MKIIKGDFLDQAKHLSLSQRSLTRVSLQHLLKSGIHISIKRQQLRWMQVVFSTALFAKSASHALDDFDNVDVINCNFDHECAISRWRE